MHNSPTIQRFIYEAKLGYTDEGEFLDAKNHLAHMEEAERRDARNILSRYRTPDEIDALFEGTDPEECA